jgi:hypothetical protein
MKTAKEIRNHLQNQINRITHGTYFTNRICSEELFRKKKLEFENIRYFSEEEIQKAINSFQSREKQVTDKIIIQEELKEYLLKELGLKA